MKNLANAITLLRIVFGAAMVFAVPFSTVFWFCYLGGGLSDLLDGAVARALHRQSEAGAKLDSLADLVFGLALGVVVVKNLPLPAWVWGSAACIAALRAAGYGIGAYKYRTFPALHTLANKLTGLLLFAFPLLYKALGLPVSCMVLCVSAFLSAAEELVITVCAKRLDRDCKGLFFR